MNELNKIFQKTVAQTDGRAGLAVSLSRPQIENFLIDVKGYAIEDTKNWLKETMLNELSDQDIKDLINFSK